MPLNLQKNLPAIELLKKEHIFVMDSLRASEQDIPPPSGSRIEFDAP